MPWPLPRSRRHSVPTCTCGAQREAPESDSNAYSSPPKDIEYRFYCEFQSHEPEFDYLKSLEIEEKINRIRWRHGRAGPLFLLSTNGATLAPLCRPAYRRLASPPARTAYAALALTTDAAWPRRGADLAVEWLAVERSSQGAWRGSPDHCGGQSGCE